MDKPAGHAEPIVILRVNDCIVSAECSACHDLLGLEGSIGTPEEQERKMKEAFERHVSRHHNKIKLVQ